MQLAQPRTATRVRPSVHPPVGHRCEGVGGGDRGYKPNCNEGVCGCGCVWVGGRGGRGEGGMGEEEGGHKANKGKGGGGGLHNIPASVWFVPSWHTSTVDPVKAMTSCAQHHSRCM